MQITFAGGENGVHYIRPLDASAFAQTQAPSSPTGGQQGQTVITLPITMPGAKPGDPQQTVQIQVFELFYYRTKMVKIMCH